VVSNGSCHHELLAPVAKVLNADGRHRDRLHDDHPRLYRRPADASDTLHKDIFAAAPRRMVDDPDLGRARQKRSASWLPETEGQARPASPIAFRRRMSR